MPTPEKLNNTNLDRYEALIFDVDGTLYDLKKMHRHMAFALAKYYILRFWRIKELQIIRVFRRVREELSMAGAPGVEFRQYDEVAQRLAVSSELVRHVINLWMLERPLDYIYACRNVEVVDFIKKQHACGKMIVYLSDYPAIDKIKRIGLDPSNVFCSTDFAIDALKPSPKGLEIILDSMSLKAAQCLLVGDREDKEGLAAQKIGMPYIII